MKIYLISGLKITNFVLPTNDEFFSYNYIIPDNGNTCLITFEKVDGSWYLTSNGVVNAFKDSCSVSRFLINDYSDVLLKILGYDGHIKLFALPLYNEQLYKLDISGANEITFGKDLKCNISYNYNLVAPLQFSIKKENSDWVLSANEDIKYEVYVNNQRVLKKKISIGNIIFVDGFKLIWMGSFIIINNPNNLIRVAGLKAYNDTNQFDNTKYDKVSEEDKSVTLYKEDDYFFHTPRIQEIVENEVIKIQAPPPSEDKDEMPWLLTIGSSVTMSASAIMMMWNVGNNLNRGGSIVNSIPQIIMCCAMIFGSLIMPRCVSSYNKKQRKKKEEKRITKFGSYLDDKELHIQNSIKRQSQIMHDNSLSVMNCKNLFLNNRNFWSREINDDDFLSVRLGIGNIDCPIKVEAPEEQFTLDDDGLLERVHEIQKKYEKIENVPINVSLLEKKITSFISNDKLKSLYVNNVLCQLITLHSGADLKIVIFTNEANAPMWDFAKYLPHCWSEDKEKRFFATNQEEIKDVSNYLSEEFKRRKEILDGTNQDEKNVKKANEYKNFDTYFLIITDTYKNNSNISIYDDIFDYDDFNCGFSVAIFSSSLKNLPSKCNTFVELTDKEGYLLERNINSKNQTFIPEYDNTIDLRSISNKLLNIPLLTKEGLAVLPQSLSFLDMYGVSKIEQLNILTRWKTNNPVNSLNAPIGVHANGEQFKLNLHEKFHGPHGLIAGSTGSGKSEFIITYILSMCINYHPYEVQFVLIDYKGGGLAGAFQNKETGVKIPHLVGTITNLDISEMNRTLVSINSELKRRQRVFNETKDMLGESTIDIYKYQKFYREGSVKEPMSHLFIISDEFAELKSQQPEFMQELISTARIGRSLGVHLILATQKPSGVVNDQIWSNSKFKVCLKVQDRSDSMEMLKKPDAASIKEAGRFYLQVGYDDFFDKGQSGWAGAKYVPSDTILKKVDESIEFINNTGEVTHSVKDIFVAKNDTVDLGDQLTNIVKNVYELGIKENLHTRSLWLDAIPEEIYIEDLKKKYGYKAEPYVINPLIGEYDKPKSQEQGLLNVNLTNGNLVIWGQSGSGKENLISTIIWSTCIEHTPYEVNFYILDFGTESLKMFAKMPHVGDVATMDESEKVLNTFIMIDEELQRRKELMVDYGGNYKDYIANSGEKLPLIVTVINSYEIFSEGNMRLAESIQNFFRDGAKYGIVFIVSVIATNGLKARSVQNFANKICLQIPNESEYRSIVSAPKGLFPSKCFGRGLVALDGGALEFQTALFCKKKDMINVIKSASEQLIAGYQYKAKNIPVVPDVVYSSMLINNANSLDNIPVGIDVKTKGEICYDFMGKKITNVLSSKLDMNSLSFTKTLIDFFKRIPNININIIDFYETYEGLFNDVNYMSNNFDKGFVELNNKLFSSKEGSSINLNIIVGIGNIKNKLSANGLAIANNIFSNAASLPNSYFVFVDTYNSIRNIQTEIWYQTLNDNTYGIWLGQDVGNQMAININDLKMEDRKANFPFIAYLVTKGEYSIFKYVVEDEEGNNE